MNVVLREAVVGDAECIAVLGATVWINTYAADGIRRDIGSYIRAEFSVDRIATLIADPTSHLVVAERSGHILGYAHAIQGAVCPASANHRAELVNLYVLETFTGGGVGTQLLRESEGFAGARGEQLWFSVNAENIRAIRFYSRRGYRDVGEKHFDLGSERYKNRVFVQGSA
jgi:diamine N-acetyltransferase